MGRRRNRLEIIYDILKVIKENGNSIKPTPLLRFSNLSSQSFDEYLKDLLEKELVKEVETKKARKHYTLTDKGFRYIEKYQTIRSFIDDFEL